MMFVGLIDRLAAMSHEGFGKRVRDPEATDSRAPRAGFGDSVIGEVASPVTTEATQSRTAGFAVETSCNLILARFALVKLVGELFRNRLRAGPKDSHSAAVTLMHLRSHRSEVRPR
jgi:hypothetical protein